MRHNIGFEVDAGLEERDEDGGMVNTGGGRERGGGGGRAGSKDLGTRG